MDPDRGHSHIEVRGARVHNLRGIDLDIPRDRLVVITGLSGSGKSSLAFDTLYAEGQRRYVESLSAYARQFLDQMSKPDVESIEGLSPAISIEQKTTSRNPRSTVGTVTEIYDHLRLLYARIGRPECPHCGRPISRQTVQQMTDRVLALGEGSRVQVLAPVIRGRKGEHKRELEQLRRQGFVRARIDGTLHDLGDEITLARNSPHDIEVVVDRLVVKEAARPRIAESIETAIKLADGLVHIDREPPPAGNRGDPARASSRARPPASAPNRGARAQRSEASRSSEQWTVSEKNACIECGFSFPEIAPRFFSFNSPAGACKGCDGLGTRKVFDAERVVTDPDRSLARGAIEPWGRRPGRYYKQLLATVAGHLGVHLDTPWRELPRKAQRALLHGTGRSELHFAFERGGRSERVKRRFDGVLGDLERRVAADPEAAEELDRFRSPRPCPDCDGSRLRPEARSVKVGGLALHQLAALPIDEAGAFLEGLELGATEGEIAERILKEIRERLRFLEDVGLAYLTLDRASATLSGGEGQRIRLATQIGSSLMGVLYILDEPSIGLHPRDHGRLLESLKALREAGNSVLVVEHDEVTIREADWVIDMGPGAGIHGGEVVAEGTPAQIQRDEASLTGAFLSGRREIPVPEARRRPGGGTLRVTGCRANNLKDVDLEIPLGLLTVVTGVSGSGKSSLVNDTLYRALAQRFYGAHEQPGAHRRIEGLGEIDKVIDVDQSPIGRTPRSNPATYTGAFDGIRALFSQVPEARVRGYGPGRFSFNVKGGRCDSCQGDGLLRIEMNFLPDLFVTCEVCRGRRYNRETLEVLYRGSSIADVLDTSVEEALELLGNVPAVKRPLQTLFDVGLGYLHLGQAATTLSGGEAQRIKLARELSRKATGRTLYLLDEPTTGLHFADVERLLQVLNRLVDRGNTVVVIEHQLDVVKTADHVIDLGPEGGAAGGRVVVQGPPEAVARCRQSHTGRALAPLLRA